MRGKERERAPVYQSAGAFFLLFILRFFMLNHIRKEQKMRKFFFRLLHKIYKVEYKTHGKEIHVEYVSSWKWEQFDLKKIVNAVAAGLRLKPEHLKIQSISRVEKF